MAAPVGGDPTQVGGPAQTEPGVVKSTLTGGDDAQKADPAKDQQPQKPTWAAQLPKDQQADADLTKFSTLGDLWKGYKDLAGKAGKPAVPGEGATAEEIAAYRKAIGVPEKPEDYKLEAKDLPQGVKLDEKLTTEFKSKAHALGIPPKEAQDLFSWYNQQFAARLQESQAAKTAEVEGWKQSVKEKWGASYDPNLRLARRAFALYGGEELAKVMDTSGLGEHPAMLEAFANIGRAIAEEKLLDPKAPAGARKPDAEVFYS